MVNLAPKLDRATNPLLLKVWQRLRESGKLEGLSGDAELEKVVSTAEKLLKNAQTT